MPYIKDEDMKRHCLETRNMGLDTMINAGNLNYLLHDLIHKYIIDQGGLSYQIINDIEGALQLVLKEFNRRIVVPYEDKKIKENGDIPLYIMYEKK